MQLQSDQEYKALLTEVIKKQIVILGPDITLAKARNVPGLIVDNDGTVTAISGQPQAITQALIDQFVQLSGLIVKKTMEPLLSYSSVAIQPALPTVTAPPQSFAALSTPVQAAPPVTPAPLSNPESQQTQPGDLSTPVMQENSDQMVNPETIPSNSQSPIKITHPDMDESQKTQQDIDEALKQVT